MKRVFGIICFAVFCLGALAGCVSGAQPQTGDTDENLRDTILVGFSQVGAESEWRVANSESMKAALSEENGYELIFDDARNEQENQIRAIRTFIQQDVDYIVFSPRVETGWNSILLEARDAGIPVIVIDRDIEVKDRNLYTAYIGSDFRKEGETAMRWLENLLTRQGRTQNPVNIVHIQGTIGSSAQIGRTAALEQALGRNTNWQIVAQECGDFTRAKAYEVMGAILKETKDIDVVYCENDGEALGAIDAMEEAGLSCGTNGGVIVISFDATKLGLTYCKEGKIALNVECNPLQGPYVADMIQRMERGEKVEQEKYVDETYFESQTITQEMIDSREY
ncbi:ABC transporter periplasmic-binding protein YtfQ [bioreactor metagenome]|uniref:ABC transporter periplasmic-binding protein YtfQ n=1 Tax=bioreactor metagenome TaxID=1076179 RepID=A0A644YMH7_9ZZZZ|nr:ABC transporter substrate-binding protein [Christensenella sp.]